MPITGPTRELAWLCVIGVAVAVAQSMTLPLVALHAGSLGAAPQAIGLVLGAGFVLPVVTAVGIGGWVDRLGAPRMILVGALGLAVGPLVPAALPSLATLTVLQVVTGVAHLAGVVAAQSYVARIAGPRERNFGMYTTFVSFGQLLGPFAVGAAIDGMGYRGALLVTAGAGVVAAALSRALPRLPRRHDAPEAPPPRRTRHRELVRAPSLRLALGASGATLFALGVHQTFFPVYLDLQHLSPTLIGVLVGLRALSAIAVRPFLAPLGRLVGQRSTTLGLTLAFCALGLAFIPLGSTVTLFAIASILVGVGSGVSQPMTMVVLADHVPAERRGAALGARLSMNFLALGMSTVLLGAIIPLFGYGPSFVVCALVPAAVAVWVWRGGARLETPRTAG